MKNPFVNGETNYQEWRSNIEDNKRYLNRMSVINACFDKLASGQELTLVDYILLVAQIVVSSLTGKLADFFAISTSVLMNKLCQHRAKDKDCICHDCYACDNVANYQRTLALSLETNFIILTSFLIPSEAWATLAIPTVNGYSRIESHGDVANVIHARNYIRIIKSHPHIKFSVWSKNFSIWFEALKAEGYYNGNKPENMRFIASSYRENEVIELPEYIKPYVDKIFTVYTKDFVLAHDIIINCGIYEGIKKIDHTCKNCMKCYFENNTDYYINELKK